MNYIALIIIGLFGFSIVIKAQENKKMKDAEAIKSMQGCYEVKFNFAETFNYSNDSNYTPSKVYRTSALEWVGLIENKENKIILQHLLIVGPPSNQRIIKHWRQDWLFENTDLYVYDYNNRWRFVRKSKNDVKGQWTQKVFQVDDSPRYEGTATWVHVDGKSYWENTTDAPLPRREYTKRYDYNVTIRGNRQEITDYGWIHDQDNIKLIRDSVKQDLILAREKGFNVYKRLDDDKCITAQDWWQENKNMWQNVRNSWNTIFSINRDLELYTEIKGKKLYSLLFDLDPKQANKDKVHGIIKNFVK